MSLFSSTLILVVADILAIATMLVVRRGAPEGSYFKDGDRASGASASWQGVRDLRRIHHLPRLHAL